MSVQASTESPHSTGPLAGVRIVEISSFVAVPLAGMTLAQSTRSGELRTTAAGR
jgi:crotonobetainyl-CoA:carnitine CoA-transferase CaiB-like acyl-CoA transferase